MSQTTVPRRAARHQQKQLPIPDPRSFFQRPPRGRRPQRPDQHPQHPPLWRRVLKYWWAWLLPIVGLGLGAVFGLVYVFGQVPVPQQVVEAQATVVVDAQGNQIGTLASEQNRRIVPLGKISDHMEHAVLAAEDHQFYEHGAVSYRGILRAAWANLTNGEVTQGGSTLTQQYVKIAYLTQERTLLRKVNEAILAIKLEQQHSKDRILEDYLNIIYFGRGAYGVEAAAQAYFRTTAAELNPQQAAFLAGIIRNPNFFADAENAEAGKQRRNTVLATMGELNFLPPGESGQWQQRNLDLKEPKSLGVANSEAPYFMEKVRLSLIDLLGAERVARGGLRVVTTLEPQLQAKAIAAVEGTIEAGENAPKVALTAIEPSTGKVVAMYGGRDFATSAFNYATDSSRQAGSTMKPFVLATALEQGINIQSRYNGSQCISGLDEDEGRELCNFNNASYGMISLLDATIKSANTPFLRLIQDIGPEAVAETANRCGFDAMLTQTGERPAELPAVPSLALGSGVVSTLQLTSGFAAIANGGVHIEPYIVTQVQDATNGNELHRHQETLESQQRCMDESTSEIVTHALEQAVETGSGSNAAIGIPAAGKTGTTNNNVDARFAGYTPQLATSVWLGYDDASRELENIQNVERVTGGTLPAGIWHDFMVGAMDLGRVTEAGFPEPNLDQGEILNPPPPPEEQNEDGQPADEDGEDGDQGDGEGDDAEGDGGDENQDGGDGGEQGGGDGQDEGDGGDEGGDGGQDEGDGGDENQDGGDGAQAQAEGGGEGEFQPAGGQDGDAQAQADGADEVQPPPGEGEDQGQGGA